MILGGASALLGVCGPFTDVTDAQFCPFVLEIFTLGITTGTTPTTYDPTSTVSRLQMAAFLSRSVDGVLKRGSRRAALDQFWTTQNASVLGLTTVGSTPQLLKSDGSDVWVANNGSDSVSRVRGSDGKLLETWTGATTACGVLVAMGRVFVTGQTAPGNLYRIDPSQPAGAVTTVASTLGNSPTGIAFDGSRIWTANDGGSVSIVTPGATIPWTVTTVTTGFIGPCGILYDGANIWVTDHDASTLLKLDSCRRRSANRDRRRQPLISGLRRNEHLGAQRRLQLGLGCPRVERGDPPDADRQRIELRPRRRLSTGNVSWSRTSAATASLSGRRRT